MPRAVALSLLLLATLATAAERRRRRAAERLGAALFETLLNAIDANDTGTGAHVRRVAAYALALADALGLEAGDRRDVEYVALFHDIGKIHEALFDIVHEGSKRLSAAARREIATHPHRGADVLAPLTPFHPQLADGVLSHHERWDGSGYPRGLAGREIPIAARIVAIADTFDAITHSRRYSTGQSIDTALDAIRRGRGTQFDPELVDLFLGDEVQGCIQQLREDQRRPARRSERRRHRQETSAPDVAFRWRERVALDEVTDPPSAREPRGGQQRPPESPASSPA